VHGLNEPVLETGPSGQIYFFNTFTRESTYVRPLPAFPATASKKEKPKLKTPIPGTDWLRVTTNQGNVFYTNKAKKESVWTVPDEIKDEVELLEKQEEDDKVRAGRPAQEETQMDDVEAEQEREIERVRMEVQEVVKRKVEDISLSDEIVVSKKPRVGDQVESKVEEADDTDDGEESEDEDWQREAAAQLAKEAEEEKRQREEDEKAEEAQKTKENVPQLTMPDRVDLSLEEGKVLFKVCLQCDICFVPLTLSCYIYRPYSGRKTSTHYIRGIRLFRSSSLIHAMCSFLPFLRVAKPSTSTVENVHGNFERRVLRKRRRTPRKSSRSSLRLR
jgi:hypothetical protein